MPRRSLFIKLQRTKRPAKSTCLSKFNHISQVETLLPPYCRRPQTNTKLGKFCFWHIHLVVAASFPAVNQILRSTSTALNGPISIGDPTVKHASLVQGCQTGKKAMGDSGVLQWCSRRCTILDLVNVYQMVAHSINWLSIVVILKPYGSNVIRNVLHGLTHLEVVNVVLSIRVFDGDDEFTNRLSLPESFMIFLFWMAGEPSADLKTCSAVVTTVITATGKIILLT